MTSAKSKYKNNHTDSRNATTCNIKKKSTTKKH